MIEAWRRTPAVAEGGWDDVVDNDINSSSSISTIPLLRPRTRDLSDLMNALD